MATPITSSPGSEQREHREHRPQEKTDKSQIIVVDLEERQASKQIRRLRNGEGKLMDHVEKIISELSEAGTIKSVAQPVVVIVREDLPWPFG
jgi:DNA-binding TFAR19-related protein (PDSD5 family)